MSVNAVGQARGANNTPEWWRKFARMIAGYLASLFATSVICGTYLLFSVAKSVSDYKTAPTVTLIIFIAYITISSSALPAGISILAGEVKALRHFAYYMLAGALTGGVAWFDFGSLNVKGTMLVTPDYTILCIVSGAVGGLVYWLIAGREAGTP